MRRAFVVCWLGVASCVSSDAVPCGNGLVCPAATVCRQLTAPDEHVCVSDDAVAACSSKAEGETCEADVPSYCHDGVCIAISCGDARLDPGEACDDGNVVAGDGTCSADCRSNAQCGNSNVDPLRITGSGTELNEECDDGNRLSGDGCASDCNAEVPNWEQYDLVQPTALSGVGLAYDSARRRVVMFGGFDGSNFVDGTYEWDGKA